MYWYSSVLVRTTYVYMYTYRFVCLCVCVCDTHIHTHKHTHTMSWYCKVLIHKQTQKYTHTLRLPPPKKEDEHQSKTRWLAATRWSQRYG
jgi:hypothetical protein